MKAEEITRGMKCSIQDNRGNTLLNTTVTHYPAYNFRNQLDKRLAKLDGIDEPVRIEEIFPPKQGLISTTHKEAEKQVDALENTCTL